MESLNELLKRQNAERMNYLRSMRDELDYMQYMSILPDYQEALEAQKYFNDNFGPQVDSEMTERHNEELFKHPDLHKQNNMESWEEMEERQNKEKAKQMEDHFKEWAEMNRSGPITAEEAQQFTQDKKREIDELMQRHMSDAYKQPGFQQHVDWQRGQNNDEQTMHHEVDEMTKGQQKALAEDQQELDELNLEAERIERARQMRLQSRDMTRDR